MASSTSFLRFLILPAALLIAGAAQADQQASASFAVSVTLHSSSKAMAAAQLCLEGRPLSLLAASSVRVALSCRHEYENRFRPQHKNGKSWHLLQTIRSCRDLLNEKGLVGYVACTHAHIEPQTSIISIGYIPSAAQTPSQLPLIREFSWPGAILAKPSPFIHTNTTPATILWSQIPVSSEKLL